MTTWTVIVISTAVRFLSSSSSLRIELKQIRDCFFWLFIACTFLVVIGVILEEIKFRRKTPYIEPESEVFIPERVTSLAKLGLWILVLGITGEGLFEMATSWIDGLSETYSNTLLLNAEALTGNAAKSAEEAQRASASAKSDAKTAHDEADVVGKKANKLAAQLGDAKKQLDAVDAKRAELERSLVNMAVCNSPRVISRWSFTIKGVSKSFSDPLKPFARKALIEYMPFDVEARRAAGNIDAVLQDAGWTIVNAVPLDGLSDGVEVEPFIPHVATPPRLDTQSKEWQEWNSLRESEYQTREAAGAVVDFLHSYNWQARDSWPIDKEDEIPVGGIRIKVGMYPAVVYVPPIGQKEFAEASARIDEEMEQKRQAAKMEMYGKILKGLTLEEATRFKATEEQRDREEKRLAERYSPTGPCKVMHSFTEGPR